MKKLVLMKVLAAVLCCGFLLAACDDGETYADMKKKERK